MYYTTHFTHLSVGLLYDVCIGWCALFPLLHHPHKYLILFWTFLFIAFIIIFSPRHKIVVVVAVNVNRAKYRK